MKKYKWFFPGLSLFMFATLFLALLIEFVPPNASELFSNMTGMFSYIIMLNLVLIASRPKWIERKIGLTEMYHVHAWMAMVLPFTLFIHVFIRWSGLEQVLSWDLTITSKLGYIGLITLIIVMLTGIFVLSDTFIKKSKKLMELKNKYLKRNTHLWLHRLSIVSVIAILFHVYTVPYAQGNLPYHILVTTYTVISLGWYFIYKIKLGRLPKYEIVRHEQPAPNIHEIEMKTNGFDRLDYQAGQYGFFRFVDSAVTSEAHPFSFSSAPLSNDSTVTIMVQEDGDFTGNLDQIKPGDRVTIEGPYGNFYPETVENSNHPLVLLSGGIGVTPNLSVLREEIAKDSNRRIAFVWGLGSKENLMYHEEFQKLAKQYPNFSYHIIFSEEEVAGFPHGFIDNEFIQNEGLEELYETATWHVCGPPPMLEAAKGLLNENNVKEEQAYIEEFAF